MKKIIAACICICFTFSMTGCSLGTMIDRFVSAGDSSVEETAPDKSRVYMDEIHGTLQDFTGSQITILSDEIPYSFDISDASLECEDGLISGDEISIIYEGQLDDTDTSAVKALKVVDVYHNSTPLKEHSAQGTVLSLTFNTITVKTPKGKTITFPITGTKQYYQNGFQNGSTAYIHYKGKVLSSNQGNTVSYDASQLKVLSVSDIDPLNVPSPTPTPEPPTDAVQEQKMFCVITGINQNLLQTRTEGSDTSLQFDMSAVPCYFPGGISEGSHATIIYTGEFNGTTLDGLTILGITGENPASEKESRISFQVTGSIIGKTSNTISILTGDGAIVTFYTNQALNASSGGFELNHGVRITYNPAASSTSNIFSCLKIEDL